MSNNRRQGLKCRTTVESRLREARATNAQNYCCASNKSKTHYVDWYIDYIVYTFWAWDIASFLLARTRILFPKCGQACKRIWCFLLAAAELRRPPTRGADALATKGLHAHVSPSHTLSPFHVLHSCPSFHHHPQSSIADLHHEFMLPFNRSPVSDGSRIIVSGFMKLATPRCGVSRLHLPRGPDEVSGDGDDIFLEETREGLSCTQRHKGSHRAHRRTTSLTIPHSTLPLDFPLPLSLRPTLIDTTTGVQVSSGASEKSG